MKGQPKHILPLPLTLATVLCVMLGWHSTALTKTIYQYIDQQGAVAFSDHPPEHTNSYIVLDIPDPPPSDPEETEKQLEEMTAVADKLEAKRKEDEAKERAESEETSTPSEEAYYPESEEDRDRGYYDFYPGYYGGYYPDYPRQQRTRPPYRDSEPDNPGAEIMERLRTPIRIPQFNTDQPLHERLEPYNPPLRPQDRRRWDDSSRR